MGDEAKACNADAEVLGDSARLEAVRRTGLLEAPIEEAFERFTRTAAMVFEAPIAMISLLGDRHQFLISAIGIPEPWTSARKLPLSHSLCRHVVISGESLVVNDAREHPRLHANLAVRDLSVRAYAGIPLTNSQGKVIGTFAVLDTKPRQWTDPQARLLRDLGASVMSEISLRTELRDHAETQLALQRSESRLAGELTAMTRLHDLVSRLLRCTDLRTALNEVLVATIEITGADMGNVQMFSAQREALEIVAQRGFKQDFLDFFQTVRLDGDAACSRAMRMGERIVIEDVLYDELYEPLRDVAAKAGYRAVQSTPLLGRGGELLGMLSTHHRRPHRSSEHDFRILDIYTRQAADFIERVRSQEARALSEAKLSAIIAGLPVGILVSDNEGNLLSLNPAGLRMHGFSSIEQFLARRNQYSELFDLRDAHGLPIPADQWPLRRALHGDCVSDFTAQLLRPDAEALTIAYNAVRVPGAAGDAGLIVLMMQDISEYETARIALQRAIVRSEAIVNQMTEGLVIFDPQGNMLDMNPVALTMHGFERSEQVLRDMERLPELFEVFSLEGDVLPLESWPIGRALAGETFDAYEVRVLLRDSGKTWIGSYGGTPVYGPDGMMILAILTIRDVTAQRNAEAALRESDRRKDVFLATLAHELRNPLAPIRSGIELLRLTGGEPAGTARTLAIMERQIKHLVRLVDDLLDLSRIGRGKVVLRREQVDLSKAIRGALEVCGDALYAGGRKVSVELPTDPLLVEADPVRLVQIIANLLNNAAKFTEEFGRIAIALERHGDEAKVCIRDDGIGIAPEMLDRIFEMFQQVDPSHSGGLGIGLTLVHNLTQMHGGSVAVFSDGVGHGSEFVVHLPITQDGGPATPPES